MSNAVMLPADLAAAHAALADNPSAHVLAGGTDLMVEVNYAQRRPTAILGLRDVTELQGWNDTVDGVVIGSTTTWTELMTPAFSQRYPALAQAARTVGSPQIRNAGTIGGNIATASPAGDGLPPLYALDAVVIVSSVEGRREVPIDELITGVKRTSLAPGELIEAIRLPAIDGPQHYLKVGTRNAMVISAAGVAVAVDRLTRTVRCALGAVAPTIVRASDAEALVADAIDWASPAAQLDPSTLARFGELAGAAASPIDDHRSTADYRRHAIGVMAERALRRCLDDMEGPEVTGAADE